MKRLVFIPFILLVLLSLVLSPPNASADELMEFMTAVERYTSSYNHWDVDTLVDIEAEAIGLDSYSKYLVNNKTIEKQRTKKGMKEILSQYEYYNVQMLTLQADVFGNTGVASGSVNISRKHKEYPIVSAKIRWSSTWIKKDGEWKLIFFHRELIDAWR